MSAEITSSLIYSINFSTMEYIPNYRINLLSPEAMSADDIEKFHTEFRQVMKFIKYSANKNELRMMLDQDKSFESVDRDTADVINVVTNSKMKIEGEEKQIDMCKAVKDLIAEGREEGLEEGLEKGLEEGLEKGREEGREKGAILSMLKMIKKGILTVAQAAELSEMSVEEFENKAALYA